MQHYVLAPGFLSYTGVIALTSLFLIFWAGPRYGKRSMLVYISVCSLVGGLSVVATQGLGSAIVSSIANKSAEQIKHWFFWVLLVFVVFTLLVEINYLNKALNIFNTSLVTPTYYVLFTSSTILASSILFKGFSGTVQQIITVVLGFLTICGGVILLQFSKSAQKMTDSDILAGDLEDFKAVAKQEPNHEQPEADAIRGTLSLRRLSTMRKRRRSKYLEDNIGTIKREEMKRQESHMSKERNNFRYSSVRFDSSKPPFHLLPINTKAGELHDQQEDISLQNLSRLAIQSPMESSKAMCSPLIKHYPHAFPSDNKPVSTTIPRKSVRRRFSFASMFSPTRNLTEEERIGLVKGDKSTSLSDDSAVSSPATSLEIDRGESLRKSIDSERATWDIANHYHDK